MMSIPLCCKNECKYVVEYHLDKIKELINKDEYRKKFNIDIGTAYIFDENKYLQEIKDNVIDDDHIFYDVYDDFMYGYKLIRPLYVVFDKNDILYFMFHNENYGYVFKSIFKDEDKIFENIKNYLVRIY